MKRVLLFAALALAFGGAAWVPSAKASATIFNLVVNDLGIPGSVGTIAIADVAGGVQVSIAMNPGFSLKLNGGDLLFSTNGTVPGAVTFNSVSIGATTITNPSITFSLTSKNNIGGLGSFQLDWANLKCSSCADGTVSADDLVLTIAGMSVSDFVPNSVGNTVGLHFCTASGGNCGPLTGFASNATVIPEPASLLLLGTGLLAFGGLLRRRKSGNPLA